MLPGLQIACGESQAKLLQILWTRQGISSDSDGSATLSLSSTCLGPPELWSGQAGKHSVSVMCVLALKQLWDFLCQGGD